jgi:hypothetical protein
MDWPGSSPTFTLGIADGVTLIPLRAADNPQRIINDVLPMLGVDAARLSA